MTTDTKAVTRWEAFGHDFDVEESNEGEFVFFTDYERLLSELVDQVNQQGKYIIKTSVGPLVCSLGVASEWEKLEELIREAEAALAASRAETIRLDSAHDALLFENDKLRAGLQEILHIHADDNHRPRAFYIAAKAIDAAMEKGNV